MSEQPAVSAIVVVHGHVQGVSFRDACRREAQHVGARGWVSNESDGTVRALFEGTREAVDHMVAWAQHGPPGAEVERVVTESADPAGLRSFEVR